MAEAKVSDSQHAVVMQFDNDLMESFKLRPEKLLVHGMCGPIYRACSTLGSGRRVAVKTFDLTGDKASKNQHYFDNECFMMKAMSHPNIMSMVGAGVCPTYAAIVMPYMNRSLLDVSSPLPASLARRYMLHVSRGLEHLHRNYIAHNDVKLDNILLGPNQRAYLTDFGLCVEVPKEPFKIKTRTVGGTREYLAPELVDVDRDSLVDPFKVITPFCLIYICLPE